ncbi:hypothetical protein [Haemophilus influenzae]|nr:hypothetical protein [Haemophilus influenzae]
MEQTLIFSLKVCYMTSIQKILWGSDNICIRKKKKIGGKKLAEAPVYGALAFLGGKFMQKWKMVGIGGKWSKIGFYFA